jgi:hypothetical protein
MGPEFVEFGRQFSPGRSTRDESQPIWMRRYVPSSERGIAWQGREGSPAAAPKRWIGELRQNPTRADRLPSVSRISGDEHAARFYARGVSGGLVIHFSLSICVAAVWQCTDLCRFCTRRCRRLPPRNWRPTYPAHGSSMSLSRVEACRRWRARWRTGQAGMRVNRATPLTFCPRLFQFILDFWLRPCRALNHMRLTN